MTKDTGHFYTASGSGSPQRNTPDYWNAAWSKGGMQAWRDNALAPVYERILALAPRGRLIIDIGGGIGHFAKRAKAAGFEVEVWEHNEAALAACRRLDRCSNCGREAASLDIARDEVCCADQNYDSGIRTRLIDLERRDVDTFAALDGKVLPIPEGATVVATEVLEHLSAEALEMVLHAAYVNAGVAFFSVPNDRLTPVEEPEHARSWTAKVFLDSLRSVWGSTRARVEVLGYPARLDPKLFPSDRGQRSNLLGIVGFEKKVAISLTMPVRDEAADLEECLASFRGFVDEIVIGVDPRTKDNTREIARKYAEKVFDLTPEQLRGPVDKPEEWVPEGGIHFANARNSCIDACSHEWVFMTEGHEKLWKGGDVLLHLDQLPPAARVVGVTRTGGPPMMRQQWLFPWLARKAPDIRYERSTHNTLGYPDSTLVVGLPQIVTLHERVHERDVARQKQRKVQNRKKLMEDWLRRGSEHSLHYLGAEWREWAPEKAIEYFKQFLATGKHGALRYQTRLTLAKELYALDRDAEAIEALHGAEADDWTRKEHWVFLGDIWAERGEFERALTFYEYAATSYDRLPVTTWFLDVALYTWMLAQRLTVTYAQLGRLEEAEQWAAKLIEYLEREGAEEAFLDEARSNLRQIQEARNGFDQAAQ